ncbi:dipeptidase [Cellulosilyticum sp. I15G10I2]|uniref:dipeptidase n=1 Tax=Cellulosilyticum sp. I15G10I2 TaxID=1892843 RepID=UPI00085BB21D|nr:dipeptidase [Cellulosilyticum sp. I15G10I2]
MPVIDLHCDTIDRLYTEKSSLLTNEYHVDLSKLKTGDYIAQWFALFIDTHLTTKPLMELIYEMYGYFMCEIKSNSDHIAFATSFKEYTEIKSARKIAAFLSLEEGQVIGGDIDNLQKLCDLGIRMMTLTWNYENELGAPHFSDKGLTEFGKKVVNYLNDSPILIDISHLSELALKEVCEIYKKPIIASHCNARSICNHSRNLSDEMIKRIANSGGVVGINLYGLFLDGTHKSTIPAIIDHIGHFYQLGGEDILALGTDFDGMNCDLEVCNAGDMGKLINTLVKLYPQSVIDKLTYKNAERIIRENL